MTALERAADQAAAGCFGANTPGCALLVAKDGEVLLRKGYGMADLERGIPVKPEDHFVIASNTKQFTCLAILMLRDRGLLELDEPIERFFPDFPDYRKRVTVRMLMSHTSGIREYFEDDCFRENEAALRTADTAAMVALAKGWDKLNFEPDTQWSYCNTAYVMLGEIVRQLSGKPFGRFLEEEIFAPLGMTGSVAPDYMDRTDPKQAVGYKEEGGAFLPQPYDMLLVGYADGNISSNVDDLYQWHRFLYESEDETLVKRSTIQEMFRSHVLKDGTPTHYGLGLFLGSVAGKSKPYPGHREVWHTGGTMGFISRISRFPDDGVSAMMLTNWDGDGLKRDETFFALLDALYANL